MHGVTFVRMPMIQSSYEDFLVTKDRAKSKKKKNVCTNVHESLIY